MIRAIPSNASDNVYCTLLAHSAIHGAMAGYSFTVGMVNGRHAYIPFHVSITFCIPFINRDNISMPLSASFFILGTCRTAVYHFIEKKGKYKGKGASSQTPTHPYNTPFNRNYKVSPRTQTCDQKYPRTVATCHP